MKFINKFYLDKEKDIIVSLFQKTDDEMTYIIETPNHHTGNLITNLAKICGVETIKDEKDMKIIKGSIPAYVVGNSSKDIYIFTLGGVEVATIYADGRIEQRVQIPAIIKTFMSQTKDYKLGTEKTLVNAYIQKKSKLKTDLHTHMNANLSPDCLIALGIKHQIQYPLYYIKKLNLKLNKEQEKIIYEQRAEVEKEYENSELTGKYLTRKIDDHTYINFADFILNNIENAEENIAKIRSSLAILKDGQAVFTNLEKVYVYRYVFAKGTPSTNKIELEEEKIEQIPENDVKDMVKIMIQDTLTTSVYHNNSLRQDKLLWIGREYQKQGITYVEIADTDLTKKDRAIDVLEEIHDIVPKIEEETKVAIRFLAAIRRIPLTIIRDQKTDRNYLRENLDVLEAVAKSPYVVGSDFIGEEINDISELQPVIEELVQYAVCEDYGFTIRIHAGENDSLKDNVEKSIKCIQNSLKPGQEIPRFRIGHGLYTPDLDSEKGKELIHLMKETKAVIEFQLSSNVRLNNLSNIEDHPIKKYIDNGVKCLQGTDGCGFYGIDTIDEQLALANLVGLNHDEFEKMKQVETEIIEYNQEYFKEKNGKFQKFLNGRSLREAITSLQNENLENSKDKNISMRINENLETEEVLMEKIKDLPLDRIPIVIAGGSFNAKGNITKVDAKAKEELKTLLEKLDDQKVFFVIGHTMQGYEKEVLDLTKELNKHFEIYAILPKLIAEEEKDAIQKEEMLTGIRISIECTSFGIYKSFNYEIFERRTSIVIAYDGNSPVSNLVQEAKNGKAKAKIYLNTEVDILEKKAKSLEGYVKTFILQDPIIEKIKEDMPEIF